MAVVTGMTAAAMTAIRNGMVTGAHFDSANHLILEKYDGTTVDGGALANATTAQAGPVELATNAETQSGSSSTLAVTPAGLASLPGYRVQIVTGIAETATPAAWPYGVSLQSVTTGSGWTPANGFGTIMTDSIMTDRTTQTFWASAGGTTSARCWTRSYHGTDGGGGWTSWREMQLTTSLTAASFTQTTAMSSYPEGWSRLYYSSSGTGWDFSGTAGEVVTYKNTTTDFARQIYTSHATGSGFIPDVWYRTSNTAAGWSAWRKSVYDQGAWISWTPTWSTTSGLHLPGWGSTAPVFKAQKLGRNVTVKYDITFASDTNFGASATTTDNWTFSLPSAWPAASSSGFLGYGDMYKDSTNLGTSRIKLASTSTISFGILICFVAGALGGGIGGDVDSVTPWTWASGHSFRGAFNYETAA
jgi:hypothetical protein